MTYPDNSHDPECDGSRDIALHREPIASAIGVASRSSAIAANSIDSVVSHQNGIGVKKLNLHDYYVLSQRMTPVHDLKSETKYTAGAVALWFARTSLFEMVSDASPVLDAAKRAGRSLISAINGIIPIDPSKLWDGSSDDKTIGYGIFPVHARLRELETVLQNEMPSVPTYIVSKKGIYSTDDLISKADCYFPEALKVILSVQARKDFSEAGRCLAFEVPTACAFHLWRAVEDAMGSYYEALTGASVETMKNKNWGATIAALKGAGAEQNVTKFLDHIREEYRNPQLHPEEMVELDEALSLFGAAGSALNQLAIAIQRAREKKTLSLPGISLAELLTAPVALTDESSQAGSGG